MAKKVLMLMTGGTIAQKANAEGRMEIAKTLEELVGQLASDARISTYSIGARTGANLTFDTALQIRKKLLEGYDDYDGFVLITGTDSMEELAFFLDCTTRIDKPIAITGAMKPSDIVGYDGIANLEQAVQVATHESSYGRGVLVVMNDNIHLARYVRKQDSQLIGAFVSHPGPVGQLRRGEVYYYFDNGHGDDFIDVSELGGISKNVPTILYSLDMRLPREVLPNCDGLVIAGMGTSSIPENWIDELSNVWTAEIPIVLVSRCPQGINFDESYYRGSVLKYEEKGFKLQGYANYNPMQARIKLILELSTASGNRKSQ